MNDKFRRFSEKVSELAGSPWAFIIAVGLIILWLCSGPFFKFSDTWQLIVNTSTTIITFLMVFLIQNTQNRDARAMHLKLDELLKVSEASNSWIDVEHLSDDELKRLQESFKKLCEDGDDDGGKRLDAVEKELTSRQKDEK